jgi:hypothetical protein
VRRGTGRTIDAYGITRFPSVLIINKDGQVEAVEHTTSEDRIHMLLYGRPLPQPTALLRLLAANRQFFLTTGAAVALILILGVVLVAWWFRRSKITVRE